MKKPLKPSHPSHPSRRTSSPQSRGNRLALAIAACFCLPSALANPTAPQIAAGSATFSTQGKTLTIDNSSGTIINWQGFSIGAGETTRFNQPSATSSVLNRVMANNPSQLLGTLQSNGRVFLINPAGILVGAGAVIDTAALVASTLSLSDADFLAGRLNFNATPGAGKVENHGSISTPSGGSVYLVGQEVDNHGIISAPHGEVLLAAGKTAQLIDTATPGVRVEITAGSEQALNVGSILAESGRIGMVGAIVRNQGKLSASSVVDEGGRIFLKAQQDTYVEGGSALAATGAKGGQIDILGQRVALLDTARVDASGAQGGGTIRVGGDYQGRNADVQNATVSYVGKDVTLKADAKQAGDGGKVIVWADQTTRFYGDISAQGGAQSGDGGFVEVSGKQYLDFQGSVSTAATRGNSGTLLLDPNGVTISSEPNSEMVNGSDPFVFVGKDYKSSILNVSVLKSALDNNNITVDGRSEFKCNSPGNVTVDAQVSWSGSTTLTLLSSDDGAVAINQAISAPDGGLAIDAGSGGVTQSGVGKIATKTLAIYSKGEVKLASAENQVNTIAADLSGAAAGTPFSYGSATDFSVGNVSVGNGSYTGIKTKNGAISITGTGAITVAGNISSGSGAVSLSAAGNVTLAAEKKIGSTGQVTITSTGNAILGAGSVTSDGLTLVAANGIGTNSTSLTVAATTSVSARTDSGDIYLNTNNDLGDGNLRIGALNATETISLSAPNGAIVDANDAAINLTASSARLSAGKGIGSSDAIETHISSLTANTFEGNIQIKNTGRLTTDEQNPISAEAMGNITIETHSPLTIGTGGISAGGNITLTAGATGTPGATGDDLTINGPVTSSGGGIALSAGNSITIANGIAVTAGSGFTVKSNANQNPAAPPPAPSLPALGECVANPTLSGCSSVLPTLDTCTARPTVPGCSVVLPTLATCTTTPTAAGCSAVLPTLASCTTAPTTAGCSAVLPTLTLCTSAPTTPGCSAVLPALSTCIASPATPGCSTVLPTLAICTTTPTLPGCSVVLPTVATCTTTPTSAGCSAVLPTLASCTTAPATPGCSVVLPSLATCVANPSTTGCSTVLPTLATCITTPTAPGCSAVLPTLATCTARPSVPGCSAVLPSSDICTIAPNSALCQGLNPPAPATTQVTDCATTAAGCTGTLVQSVVEPLHVAQGQVVDGLQLALTPTSPSAPGAAGGVQPTGAATAPAAPGSAQAITAAQVAAAAQAAAAMPLQTLAGGVVGGEAPNTFGTSDGASPESGGAQNNEPRPIAAWCN